MTPSAHEMTRRLAAAVAGLALVAGLVGFSAPEARADEIVGDACYASEVRFEGLTAGTEVFVAVADSGLRVQPYPVTGTAAGGSARLTARSDGVATGEVTAADGAAFACSRARVTWRVLTASPALGEWVQTRYLNLAPVYPLAAAGGNVQTFVLAFKPVSDPIVTVTLADRPHGRVRVTLKSRSSIPATVLVKRVAKAGCSRVDVGEAAATGTTVARRTVELQGGWTMTWTPRVKTKGCLLLQVDATLGQTKMQLSRFSSVVRVR